MTTKHNGSAKLECKRAGSQIDGIAIDGSFAGYASLYDIVDLGNEKVRAGAFAGTLRQRGLGGIRMLFQHNPDEPIGTWTSIVEDERGLFVKGQLNLEVGRAREVHALMRDGAIDGLSIGFKTVRGKTDQQTGIREIIEADLWEISIVTFPMLPQARIASVKAARDLPTKRQFERWLVRDAGLTRGEARQVIAKGYASLSGVRDAAGLNGDRNDLAILAKTMRIAARKMIQT